MKSVFKILLSICVLVFMFSGCESTSNVAPAANVSVSKHVERELIDWKGAAIGSEIPSWVVDAVDQNYKSISALPQFENRYYRQPHPLCRRRLF